MSLRVSTFNARSLNDKTKILFLYDFLIKYNVDVCFIQETLIHELDIVKFFRKTFVAYDLFITLTEGNFKGVAICVKKDVGLVVKSDFFDEENRIYGLDISFNNENFCFVNIYSPNSVAGQNDFIDFLHNFLLTKKNIILGGDFNYVEDRVHEKNNDYNWNCFFKNYNLCEFEWFVNYLNVANCKTWSNGYKSSRIDRFYTQNHLVKNCKYIEILETSVSDHKLVLCEMTFNNCFKKRRKLNIWKLNESILEHDYIHNNVIDLCKKIPINNNKFINNITNYLKHESRIINKKKKENINNFYKKLKELDQICDQEYKKKEKEKIRNEIVLYYDGLRHGNEVRIRNDKLKFAKQPTKVLIQEEIKQNTSCMINQYETMSGMQTGDINLIKNSIITYWERIP